MSITQLYMRLTKMPITQLYIIVSIFVVTILFLSYLFFNKIPENSPASVGSGMNPVFLYVKSFFSEIPHIYRRKIFMRKEKRADATKSI